MNNSCGWQGMGLLPQHAAGREKKAGIFAQTAASGNENTIAGTVIVRSPDEWRHLYQSFLI
ncbi:hypothetical protein [Halopseudomonas oceani]|uniref:hypothetical protein n=1 Tax=Halopseudomonas oceani TaxID=1708783 RepID=UPI002AA90618|nr:hypothetical protein [Halopseudomonas oceani]